MVQFGDQTKDRIGADVEERQSLRAHDAKALAKMEPEWTLQAFSAS